MSCAKKINPPLSDHDASADAFIKQMRQETGCSEQFLADARSSIVKMYRDVQGEALASCVADVRALIEQQAETEIVCQRAKKDALKLEYTHQQLDGELKLVRRQMLDMRNTLRATAFSMLSRSKNQTKA